MKQLKTILMSKPVTFDKIIKKFVFLVVLLILSPIVLSLGFKAFRIYSETSKMYITYILLITGVFLILFTVYFGFKTIKAFLDFLFKT